MKRFVITESEKNNIREMYGMLKEQTIPKKPTIKTPKKLEGVKINGLTYKLPQIKNEVDLHNFVGGNDTSGSNELFKNCNVTQIDLKDKSFCDTFKFSKSERDWPYDNKGNLLLGIRLTLAINEFIRLNALYGKTEPIPFPDLKGSIGVLLKNADYQNAIKTNTQNFVGSDISLTTSDLTYILDLLIANTGSSSSKVMNYYKQQLSKRIV